MGNGLPCDVCSGLKPRICDVDVQGSRGRWDER
uniref:Uncharacterized protein n=1 Tax=Rhizophora mucronata TaxID=61149 RepID=A0A2P2NQD8_RHIMU